MKKEYKDLEMETVRFEAEDVITASGEECKAASSDACEQFCPGDAIEVCRCDDADYK